MSGIKALRQEHGLTQTEMAECLGVAVRTVAAYESGERKPSTKVMKRLMERFHLDLQTVWGYFEETES